MSNYTDFHEWLNEFMPGIYSDNFTLTPGNISVLVHFSSIYTSLIVEPKNLVE